MQTYEDHSNLIQALNVDSLKVDLVVIQNTYSEKEDSNSETASSKSVKKAAWIMQQKMYMQSNTRCQKQKKDAWHIFSNSHSYLSFLSKADLKTQESKIDTGKALDANLVDTESIRIDSTVQDDSSRVDQYPEACQVKSHMLDSPPDNQTTEYSKQSLEF
ncbi:hypothetical protein Tco_0478921 [Tanacetum coccineum]